MAVSFPLALCISAEHAQPVLVTVQKVPAVFGMSEKVHWTIQILLAAEWGGEAGSSNDKSNLFQVPFLA